MSKKRIIVVGGVAAGAGAAAKARRDNENVEIVMFERGEYMSFANCGLPYYIGGTISDREELFVADPVQFAARFRVDVKLQSEVLSVDRGAKSVVWAGVDGKEQVMTFITNHMTWAPGSVCDLYKCRWSIEVFFKQLKQTLQLSDFLGHNKNAIQWQLWTALLTYVLLRFAVFMSNWTHSFTRIFTVLRGVLWSRYDLASLLKSYGTAGGSFRMLSTPEQAYFPGFGLGYGTAHGWEKQSIGLLGEKS